MSRLTLLTLAGIRAYQRFISPRKGFRCAHAAVHGGDSCSAAVTRIVQTRGLWAGRAQVLARFRACRLAHGSLQAPGLSIGSAQGGPRVRGVCCCGPLPIPFRCG